MEVAVLDVGGEEVHGPGVDAEDVDPGDGGEVAFRTSFAHAVDRADARHDRVDLVVHHRRDEHQRRDRNDQQSDDHAGRRRGRVGDALLEVVDDEGERVRALHDRIKQEEHEVLLVVRANTIIHPGAVVVHAHDAAVAYSAVVRPRRLVRVAPAADRLRDARLTRANQRLRVPRHGAGIREHRLQLTHQRHERHHEVDRHVVDTPASHQRHVQDHHVRVQRQQPQQRRHHRPRVVPLV
mmetsp:Transcript_9266/g.28426  ORF Transcript_9266/g.28426 Transcript_9266/m.28426 type:complete len:238 (+) Transcript_9266:539-1252(+)